MDQHRHAGDGRAVHHGHGHKAALGKDDVRVNLPNQRRRLERACDDAEGIGEIAHVEIAAQLAALDDMIGHAVNRLDQTALDAVFGPDVVDFPALGFKRRDQRQIGRDMAGRSAAGQNDLFHGSFIPPQSKASELFLHSKHNDRTGFQSTRRLL